MKYRVHIEAICDDLYDIKSLLSQVEKMVKMSIVLEEELVKAQSTSEATQPKLEQQS
jgi:hypothetical protein